MIKQIYYYLKTLIEYIVGDIVEIFSDLFKPKQWIYIGVICYVAARILDKSYDYVFLIIALVAFLVYWGKRGDWRREMKADDMERWRGGDGEERVRK